GGSPAWIPMFVKRPMDNRGPVIPPVMAHGPPEPAATPVAELVSKSPGPWPTAPKVPAPHAWIQPACSKHHDTIVNKSSHVAQRIADINVFRRRAIDVHVAIMEQR